MKDSIYLNTALMGLPPESAVAAVRTLVTDWERGQLDWQPNIDRIDAVRKSFAQLIQQPSDRVAIGHTVAATLSAIAAALPSGSGVLIPENEHNSVVYPFTRRRDLKVEFAPLGQLADRVSPSHAAVAFGLVQSADGRIANLEEISEAARRHGAFVITDASQGCGWLPFDAGLCDVMVTVSYKWLLGLNGPAFLYIGPGVDSTFQPPHRSWIGNLDKSAAPYGPGGEPALDARRFDVVQNMLAMAGLAKSLDYLLVTGIEAIHEQNIALARKFCDLTGLPFANSAIVAFGGTIKEQTPLPIKATRRNGRVRLAFHINNDLSDVTAAAEATVIQHS